MALAAGGSQLLTSGAVFITHYVPEISMTDIFLWSQTDTDNDGQAELLFYGFNNSSRYTLDAMPQADAQAYVLIPSSVSPSA